jgi:hypothetical protein
MTVCSDRGSWGGALKGGMPVWRYIASRFLTFIENVFLAAKLSEHHNEYRAFSRSLLEKLPIKDNPDDFVFDNQILAQFTLLGYQITEVSCPTIYFPEASSINFIHCIDYGIGCLKISAMYRLAKLKLISSPIFPLLLH